jgi:hypothetical protein
MRPHMKPIPFFICAALAIFLNQQVNRQSYPLGFFGSGLVFTISVGYCAVYLAIKSIAILKISTQPLPVFQRYLQKRNHEKTFSFTCTGYHVSGI